MKPSGTPAILGLAILCLVKASVQPSLGAPKRTPPFAEVAVVPLTVVPQPMPRASAQKDQDDLVQRLAEKATVRAIRSLLRRGIAEAVRAASPKDSSAEQLLVTGTVRLPVPLPSHLVGLSAQLRRGRLATANVAIRRADGTTVARAGAMLDWSDVLWTYGGRVQHPRPQEAVLEEAVQEVVRSARFAPVVTAREQRADVRVGQLDCFVTLDPCGPGADTRADGQDPHRRAQCTAGGRARAEPARRPPRGEGRGTRARRYAIARLGR